MYGHGWNMVEDSYKNIVNGERYFDVEQPQSAETQSFSSPLAFKLIETSLLSYSSLEPLHYARSFTLRCVNAGIRGFV